jgi:hypothetical protein
MAAAPQNSAAFCGLAEQLERCLPGLSCVEGGKVFELWKVAVLQWL